VEQETRKDSKIRAGTPDKIELASKMIAEGGVVAIPTDTVYGLAADALDKYAVARVFEIKGRPPTKPLVIFAADLLMAKKLAHLEGLAVKLAEQYWPGPLTLVVPRYPDCPLPHIVTAGFDSLGVRIPANPIALALLKACHRPLVVTSANRSGKPSTTTAQAVSEVLCDDIDLILDGGPSDLGEVSTVLDVRGEIPVILRPGVITKQDLEEFLGSPVEGHAT